MARQKVSHEVYFCRKIKAKVALTIKGLHFQSGNKIATRLECNNREDCGMVKKADRYGTPIRWRNCPACLDFFCTRSLDCF